MSKLKFNSSKLTVALAIALIFGAGSEKTDANPNTRKENHD